MRVDRCGLPATAGTRAVGRTEGDRIDAPAARWLGATVTRSVDEMVSAVLPWPGSAPHLRGARLPRFGADLRKLPSSAAPEGDFTRRLRDRGVVVRRL